MVQQFCKSITTLAFLVFSGLALAQGSTAPMQVKADAPDRYTVVRGDTLWGISQRYTDSPWRWPELWNLNKEQIHNPHLIYPGNVILLDRASGRLSISDGSAANAGGAGAGAGGAGSGAAGQIPTVKYGPKSRGEALSRQEIPSIPASAIEPFLSRPLVIEPDGLDKAPTIVATQGDRVILAAGNAAYVRGIGSSTEDSFYIYRRGGPLVDPDTNQTLAYEAIYLGTARLTRAGDPATVTLTSAVLEVNAGDKLVAAGRPQIINYAPRAPATQISGRIISVYGSVGRVGEAGPQSIVSINRGRANGLEVGHVLALYAKGGTVRDTTKAAGARDAQIALPNERAGLAFVFRVFDRVSYALVMNLSRPIGPLDVVQTP